jgi:hypothetical protein
MKRVKPVVAVVCVSGVTLLAALLIWGPGDVAGKTPQSDRDSSVVTMPKHGTANADSSTSIFNDKIRCFKFRIEHADVVTVEEAAVFMERYSKRGNPEIIGAYADPDANLLVVIGPPEAEQAIRNNLATAVIAMQGISLNGNLKIQKRTLQSQGRELIRDLAAIELVSVKLAAIEDENRDKKIKLLDSQMHALGAELDVIEQQIQIIDKYLKRLGEQPFGTAQDSNAH